MWAVARSRVYLLSAQSSSVPLTVQTAAAGMFFLTHAAPFLTQGHVTAAAKTITPAAVNNTEV